VVAIDCTQDYSILCAGKSRELLNHIQQLRKSAGLELSDTVEAYYKEDSGVTLLEDAVSRNIDMFRMKLKGGLPLPAAMAPVWSMKLASDVVDIGGANVEVSIHRPSIAARDGLSELIIKYLTTVDPSALGIGSVLTISIDGVTHSLIEGQDFWTSTAAKFNATKV